MAGGSVPPQGRSSRATAQKYPCLVRPRPGSSTGATVSSTAILPEARMSSRRNIDRLELGGRIAHPDRAREVEALGGQHLGLPVERQVPSVFGDQHRATIASVGSPPLISRSGA